MAIAFFFIIGVSVFFCILFILLLLRLLTKKKSSLAEEIDPVVPLLNSQNVKYDSSNFLQTFKPSKSAQDLTSTHALSSSEKAQSTENTNDAKDDKKELILEMEVISGPSSGNKISRSSALKYLTADPSLSFSIGRIPKNDLVLDDPEVSGKHALVSFNAQKGKWVIMDRGSLNGTTLNSSLISPPENANAEKRKMGNYFNLSNGDVIIFGTNSTVLVKIFEPVRIVSKSNYSLPFVFAGVEDPMISRKTGINLPMQDFLLCKWPIEPCDHLGLFCIFDGHGGDSAAEYAKRMFPLNVSELLKDENHFESIFKFGNARNLLRECFESMEQQLLYDYEGCTATVIVVWKKHSQSGRELLPSSGFNNNGDKNASNGSDSDTFFVQCANVGDSHCILGLPNELKVMSKDHKVSNPEERQRLNDSGFNIRSDEKRIFGLNLARVLGDQFIKSQNVGIISTPYISEPVEVKINTNSLCILASDGLWDVISFNRAIQIAKEERERKLHQEGGKNKARRIASALLNRARACKTQDNTSIIVVDFSHP